MKKYRTITAKTATLNQRWPATSMQSRMLRRDSVGIMQRSTVERSMGAFSIAKHMLDKIMRLGRKRRLGTGLDSSYPGVGQTRPIQLDEHFCGWNGFHPQKRSFCVGKTKFGKGTKLMVAASGEGIHLEVHVASTSPRETKLIETLSMKRHCRKTKRVILWLIVRTILPRCAIVALN